MTRIEWTDETWNPIVGCSVVSPGCTNCYAMREARRLAANPRTPQYKGTVDVVKGKSVWNGQVHFVEGALLKPLKWRKPRRIFVNSMGDLFHEKVPDDWIDRVFAVMALTPRHTFQVLTKRPDRMRAWTTYDKDGRWGFVDGRARQIHQEYAGKQFPRGKMLPFAPLPHVWLGTSVEDEPRLARLEDLRATPAAVRFISAEPLLGPLEGLDLSGIDWVICGGESGPGARPMHPDWARSLRDQCQAAGVPFFFKQWGEWSAIYDRDRDDPDWRQCPTARNNNERYVNLVGGYGFHGDRVVFMRRTGKKTAGRTLDGRAWDQMPGSDDRDQASGINQQTVM